MGGTQVGLTVGRHVPSHAKSTSKSIRLVGGMDGQPHVFSRDHFTLMAKFFGVYPLECQFLNNDSRP